MKTKIAAILILALAPLLARADGNTTVNNPPNRPVPVRYTGNVFKTFTITASGAEATIWTPASGKKFRVTGWTLFSDTATVLTFRDGTGGTIIVKTGIGANQPSHPPPLGWGILSATANNPLTLQPTTAATINGTVFGTEE